MSDIYISMGSIVAGIAKEMSEIITDNDIDLESLDYDEIEEQFDIIKGHAMLLTKENEELKKKIEDLNRICLGAICWDAVEELTKDNMKLQDEIEQLKDRGDICEEIAKLKEELEEWKDAAEDTNSETPGELSDWIGASIHEDDELYSKYTEPLELRQEIEKLKEICMGMCKQLEDVTKHEISDPDHYYRGIKAVEELKEHLECEEDGYPTSDWFKEKLDFHIKYHFTNEGGEYYENMKDLKEKPNCLDDLIYGSLERIREENKKLKGANEEEEN